MRCRDQKMFLFDFFKSKSFRKEFNQLMKLSKEYLKLLIYNWLPFIPVNYLFAENNYCKN